MSQHILPSAKDIGRLQEALQHLDVRSKWHTFDDSLVINTPDGDELVIANGRDEQQS